MPLEGNARELREWEGPLGSHCHAPLTVAAPHPPLIHDLHPCSAPSGALLGITLEHSDPFHHEGLMPRLKTSCMPGGHEGLQSSVGLSG